MRGGLERDLKGTVPKVEGGKAEGELFRLENSH